jgi:hypothetical protein
MGDLGQSFSKQGKESNTNRLWFMDVNLVEHEMKEAFHNKNNIFELLLAKVVET